MNAPDAIYIIMRFVTIDENSGVSIVKDEFELMLHSSLETPLDLCDEFASITLTQSQD
jgi:hypothetical protein